MLSAERKTALADLLQQRYTLYQQNQLYLYQPVSEESKKIHASTCKQVFTTGGNRSSKSDTHLVELCTQLTGIVPRCLGGIYPREKLRPPIRARLVCKSLLNTWDAVLRPKLQWWQWNGRGNPGGGFGHWGWIPPTFLIDGEWAKSWNERHRTLQLTNGSTLQVMCIAADTPVLMADGTWLPLKYIFVDDEVYTRKGPRRVINTFYYEQQLAWKIKMWGGFELIANAEHRHILTSGEEKQTCDLEINDVLKITNYDLLKTQEAQPDWRLGWTAIMIGGGRLVGKQAEFTAVGSESHVLNNLPPLPPGCELKVTVPGKTYHVTSDGPIRGNPLVMSLKKDGLWGKGSETKFIPSWVFRQPRKQIGDFLFWLWMTNGTAYGQSNSYYITTSPRLAGDVQRLLWRIDLKATISKVWHQGGFCLDGVWAYHVITNWRGNTRGVFGQIREIEPIGRTDVGCLEVEGEHEFIANGIVTGNSYDQDLQDFSGGSFHLILEDEGPPQDIHRENLMRTLDVGGRIMVAMTPPDDESDSWDAAWVYDGLYLPGLLGTHKDPDIDTFNLFTEQNRTLAPEDIETISKRLTPQQREVRLHGKFMHLGGRIYPNFTPVDRFWCFSCNSLGAGHNERCSICGSELLTFRHVEEPFEIPRSWLTVFALDPHPRKPNCCLWVSFDQNDDAWIVAEFESSDPPATLKRQVEDIENNLRLNISTRLIDPKMGGQSGGVNHREHSVQEEFDAAGLHCTEATSDRFTARSRIRDWLVPCPRLRAPRLHIFNTCRKTIFQFERYSWDSYTTRTEARRDVKQEPQEKHSDFPTLLGYVANGGFSRDAIGEIIQRMPGAARGINNSGAHRRRAADQPVWARRR